jgi:hypothetical protein
MVSGGVFSIGMGLVRILEETNQEESFLNNGAVDQLIIASVSSKCFLWKGN